MSPLTHLLPPPSITHLSRNAALEGLFDGGQTPKPLKTGTTIAGVVFKVIIKGFINQLDCIYLKINIFFTEMKIFEYIIFCMVQLCTQIVHGTNSVAYTLKVTNIKCPQL